MIDLASMSIRFGPLLAQDGQIADMGSRFRDAQGPAVGEMLGVIALVIAISVAIGVIAWYFHLKERRAFNSPRALFTELCRAHELSRADRRLLRRLSKAHRLASPAAILLRPDCFAEDALGENDTAAVVQLKERLFG